MLWGTRRRIATASATAVIVIAFAGSAAASGSRPSRNQHAVAVTIKDYRAYQKVEIREEPQVKAAINRYVSTVDAGCHGAVSTVTGASNPDYDETALDDLGDETYVDVTLSPSLVGVSHDRHFYRQLSRLHWGHDARGVVKRYIALSRVGEVLATSKLCDDINAFVADPTTIPAGTKRFLARFAALVGSGYQDANFFRLLKHHLIAADRRSFKQLTRIDDRIDRWFTVTMSTASTRLLNDLGFPLQ